MEKMKMSTPDLTDMNIGKIGALFPNVITETKDENGDTKKAVDFDLLRQVLSNNIVEDENERYRLDWPGKKASLLKANTPITKTLRPCREESVNFDTTENLYIEGDNFEVLKILQESYLGKIKMIYIDPPYNTGNDFIYRDNFSKNKDEYEQELGLTDEEGGKLFKNTDTNGRYHSDWLSMMYERLLVARDLLRDDGVIFISIDDNEVHNLRKICDEVFGEENLVADLIWSNKEGGGSSDTKYFRIKHEHILCFSKNLEVVEVLGTEITNSDRYKETDRHLEIRGPYYLQKLGMGSIQYSESLDYPIETPDGSYVTPKDNNSGRKACWRWSKQKFVLCIENVYVVIKKHSKGILTVYTKQYLKYDNDGNHIARTQRPFGIIDRFSSTQASKLLENLNLGNYFQYTKPYELIIYLIERIISQHEIILDFFSGSATTAHAVMQLNANDGGNRKFIMVQLPEPCDENSEAFKTGYKTIAEIGKERIRRAGNIIIEELKKKDQQLDLGEEPVDPNRLDIGFRVYKTDTSNLKDVFYHPSELDQGMLSSLESNIKEDRTPEDLLTQVLLDLGLELTLPIETKQMFGNTVYIVQTNALITCFDENVDFRIADQIADLKPLRVVFRDASFIDDKDRINVEERFKRLSPETKVTVV